MIRDFDILKICANRHNFDLYRNSLNEDSLCSETKLILDDFKVYFQKFPEDDINFDAFSGFFHHVQSHKIKTEDRQKYDSLFQRLKNTQLSGISGELMAKYREQQVADAVKTAIEGHQSIEHWQGLIDTHLAKEGRQVNNLEFVDMNLKQALTETDPTGGYQWRLSELNRTLGTILPWTFGVVAARPNGGKSSFLVSELTYVAQQLQDDECILWLNNENKGIRIVPRLYCAMLGATRDEIEKNQIQAITKFNQMGGNRIKILDIQQQNYKAIEHLTKRLKPRMIIIDMLDNVKGFEGKKHETVDAPVERLYQWALELSCVNNCTVIGTSQMNFQGEDQAYPPMSVLKASTTGKQGAASWILMIGQRIGPEFANVRFLSAPKSKFGDGTYQAEVQFDSQRSLFLSKQTKFKVFDNATTTNKEINTI